MLHLKAVILKTMKINRNPLHFSVGETQYSRKGIKKRRLKSLLNMGLKRY